jgi:hypothetical protein
MYNFQVQEDRKKILAIKKKAEERLAPFEREIDKTKQLVKSIDKEIEKEVCLNYINVMFFHVFFYS